MIPQSFMNVTIGITTFTCLDYIIGLKRWIWFCSRLKFGPKIHIWMKKNLVISATGNLASSLTSTGACIQVHISQHTPKNTQIFKK